MPSSRGQLDLKTAALGLGGDKMFDLGDDAAGDDSVHTSTRESVNELILSLSSGSYSLVWRIGGLILISSRSLGPKNLNRLFFTHGVLFGLIAVRAAFDRRKK